MVGWKVTNYSMSFNQKVRLNTGQKLLSALGSNCAFRHDKDFADSLATPSTVFVHLDAHCALTIPYCAAKCEYDTENSKLCCHGPSKLITASLIQSACTRRYKGDMRLLLSLEFTVLFYILPH